MSTIALGLSLALAGAGGAAMPATAVAQSAPVSERQFSIPAGSLGQALDALASQSGATVMYAPELVAGKTTHGVTGRATAGEALNRLLEGTGLESRQNGGDTFVLRRAAKPADRPKAQTQAAQADAEEQITGLPALLVTGKKWSLNADIQRTRDDVQPYVVFDRGEIESSGARDLDDFLRQRMTANASTKSFAQAGQFAGNTSDINLRGLGSDETLILVDGRRLARSGSGGMPGQPDINGIPISAVERIEVLPTTASGIYGGGATGGVVNIVLRRDYEGLDVKMTYGASTRGDAKSPRLDVSGGFSLEDGRTNVLIAASAAHRDELRIGDRDLFQRGRAHILENNPGIIFGALAMLGARTNIVSASGTDLTLKAGGIPLGSTITTVPAGYLGASADGGLAFVGEAGRHTLDLANTAQGDNGGSKASLLAETNTHSANLTVKREFSSWLDGFLDVSTSRNQAAFSASSTFAFAYVPETTATNPFNEPVYVVTPVLGGDGRLRTDYGRLRFAGGFIFDLPAQWRGSVEYIHERMDLSFDTPPYMSPAAGAAIASGDIDVFADTNVTGVDFSPFMLAPGHASGGSSLEDFVVRLSGPLGFGLPGGKPTLSVLAERRIEGLDDYRLAMEVVPGMKQVSYAPAQSQSINSLYLEGLLPIVGEGNALPWLRQFEIQVAGRWDAYQTNAAGSIAIVNGIPSGPIERSSASLESIDPTLGLRISPSRDVTFRASYGTGFLPPQVDQLAPAPPVFLDAFTASLFGLVDPLRGNEPLGSFLLAVGGNANLRPEESESWSAGVILTPTFAPGLRLSADWMRIDKTQNIIAPETFSPEALGRLIAFAPDRITRSAPVAGDPYGVGPITGIDGTLINFANTRIETVDLRVDYRFGTERLGDFTVAGSATRILDMVEQLAPDAPEVKTVELRGALKWRANATLKWENGPWTAAWTTRFFDGYFVNEAHAVSLNQGSDRVASQTYHDLFVSYNFARAGAMEGPPTNIELQLGVNNVFDSAPPVDVTQSAPYYSGLGDPRLANYYLSVRVWF